TPCSAASARRARSWRSRRCWTGSPGRPPSRCGPPWRATCAAAAPTRASSRRPSGRRRWRVRRRRRRAAAGTTAPRTAPPTGKGGRGVPRLVKTRFEFEGRVQERYVVVEDDPAGPLPDGAALRYVGRPQTRVDAWEKVTGRARYTHDVRLPGMVHAVIVRSPYPHARIRAIRTERALAIPGVLAVLTHENCPP